MIRYCLAKWDRNNPRLMEALKVDETLGECGYKHLVELMVTHILNDDSGENLTWDAGKITEINDGDYQGTLLFLNTADTYQPGEAEYLLTFVDYGSCSGCDTLQSIQCGFEPAGSMAKECFGLCRDLVANIVKPYNTGWRKSDAYEPVVMEENA